jgi:hypothetical protein
MRPYEWAHCLTWDIEAMLATFFERSRGIKCLAFFVVMIGAAPFCAAGQERAAVRKTARLMMLVRQVIRGERTDVFRTRQSLLDVHLPWLDEHRCRDDATPSGERSGATAAVRNAPTSAATD